MELYEWQKRCLERWRENRCRGIADVITGAGKTVLALEAARRLSEEYPGRLRVRIVTPTLTTARQWVEAIRKYERDSARIPAIGMYHGKRKDSPECDYMIYVVNSARYALSRHILTDMAEGRHVFLIADECHHYAGAENRRIFEFYGKEAFADERYHCLGLSATPGFDEDKRFLETVLGEVIYHYRFREAICEGTVSRFFIYQIGLSFLADELRVYDELSNRMGAIYHELQSQYPQVSEMRNYEFFRFLNRAAAGDGEDSAAAAYVNLSYKRAAVSHMAAGRDLCVLELIRQLDPATRILVFCERIRQAENLLRILRQQGIRKIGTYHSGMAGPSRKRVLDDFREGEIRILISCKALDEGLDVPDAVAGIVMSGSSMTRQRIQRIGRILRRQEGKPWACLYYLYVRESAEDSTFLMEYKSSGKVCNLSFDPAENVFLFPNYEDMAAGFLRSLSGQGMETRILKETRRCLLQGLLLPDWMTEPEELERRMQAAEDQRQRNYLLCMKRIAERQTAMPAPRF